MRFKAFIVEHVLVEGGNNTINGAEAQPIPISSEKFGENSIPRGEFRDLVVDSIKDMDKQFKAETNNPLYKDFSVVEKGKVFAGSTSAFIDPSISDEAYTLKKPQIGDIDLQVNKMYAEPLKEFLTKRIGKKFGELTFKGFIDGGLQLITVFGFPAKYKKIPKYFQLDMELVEFKGTGPTDISLFMRSSHWDDIQKGIKGSLHKFWLQSLMITDERFLVINKRGLKKVANDEALDAKDFKKKQGNKVTVLGPEGAREKYFLVLDNKKKPVSFNGQRVFDELSTADSKMITDMKSIFEVVTKQKATPQGIKLLGSFIGIIKLLKQFKTPSKNIENYIFNFANSMWNSVLKAGKTKADDLKVKSAGWSELQKEFPKEHAKVVKKLDASGMIENFYKTKF